MITAELTEEEWELIQTIRNYRKAYPNGAKILKTEINELMDVLMDVISHDYNQEAENQKEQN